MLFHFLLFIAIQTHIHTCAQSHRYNLTLLPPLSRSCFCRPASMLLLALTVRTLCYSFRFVACFLHTKTRKHKRMLYSFSLPFFPYLTLSGRSAGKCDIPSSFYSYILILNTHISVPTPIFLSLYGKGEIEVMLTGLIVRMWAKPFHHKSFQDL